MFRGSGTSGIGERAFGESEHATLVNCSRCGSSGEQMFPAQITRAGSGWGRGRSPVSSLRLLFGTADEAGRTIIFSSPDFGGHSPVPSLRLLFGTADEAGRTIILPSPDFGERSPIPSLCLFFGTANKAGRRIIFPSPDFGVHSPVPLRKYCGRATVFHRGVFLPQR